jgi:Questin oxidase-like
MADELDDALDRLRGTGPQVVRGMDPNHGPMVVEALIALGRASVAPQWAEQYRQRLGTLAAATSPVTTETWREALGVGARFPDWIAFFNRRLAGSPWQKVLEEWLPRLVPAIVTAGMHGLIRTAHAARALSRGSTPLRVDEMGVALAYWCSYYGALAGAPQMIGDLDLRSAIADVPRIMRGRQRTGIPRQFVYEMSGKAELITAVQAASEPQSVTEAISTFSEAGARLYLANRSRYPLIFIHAVTAPAAFRLLLPHMTPETQRAALGYFWQSQAAMIAAYGEDSDAVDSALQSLPSTSWTELVDRCIEDADPHSIKFVEASERESRARPSAAYMAAVLDWSNRRRSARSWNHEQHRAAGMAFG